MAIHVTFSMINSLVHSFCKCLCALWEILKQRKTQTKKYHDKYKPNYHPYASTQLPHSMLLAGENVSSGKSNSACPILSTSISGRGSPLNAFIAETIVLAPIHFHARFTRFIILLSKKYFQQHRGERTIFTGYFLPQACLILACLLGDDLTGTSSQNYLIFLFAHE